MQKMQVIHGLLAVVNLDLQLKKHVLSEIIISGMHTTLHV